MGRIKIMSMLLVILTCQLYAQPDKHENRLSYKVIFYAGGVPVDSLNTDSIKNLDSIKIIDNHGNSKYSLIEYNTIIQPPKGTALLIQGNSKFVGTNTKSCLQKLKKGDKVIFCEFKVKNASGNEVKIGKNYIFEIK